MVNTPDCVGNRECAQYCQVLNNLTSEAQTSTCEWPGRIKGDYDFSAATTPDLARHMANRLFSVLMNTNAVQESLANPKSELSVAYAAQTAVFDARMALWGSYATASKQGRVITDVEVDFYTRELQSTIKEVDASLRGSGVSKEKLTLAQAMHDRKTMEDTGLLFDEGMVKTVTHMCANVAGGVSTLAVGDKGIAKTQAAKFVSGLFSPDGKPRVISGDGSMMKDEFIGKMTLSEKNGATVTTFQQGILTDCMEQGTPLVMDEINLIDPAIAMRLQDILLRKPGDEVSLQEDGGKRIVIKPGFCVIATANEASSRYQSRAALDPAFRDRFVVLPIQYPDGDTEILKQDQLPGSLVRLAYAHVVSRNGLPSNRVSATDAYWLARIAHASQQLYSKPAKDVRGSLGGNVASVVDDTEPRMNDCITPRTMVRILKTVDTGLNPYDIAAGIRGLAMDTIAAMQRDDDRATMLEVVRLLHGKNDGQFDEKDIKKRMRIA